MDVTIGICLLSIIEDGDNMVEPTKLSFVIPCYRSEHTVMVVVDEIEHTMTAHDESNYEIILVNDGSPDQVWRVIQNRCTTDSYVIGVDLSKNFGQHCALMAGYHQARGEYIISLDDDGQTPADQVYLLLDKIEEGYDVVYATYPTYHQTTFRRFGSNFANRMTAFMLNVNLDSPKGSSYFVMRRYICNEIIRYDHPYPYLAGLVLRATRAIAVVPVQHRDRLSGKSGYSLKALVSLWLNGFTAFSVKPLEIGSIIGITIIFIGFIFGMITFIRKLVNPNIPAGWNSLIAVLMILCGMIMVMLGLIGEYIGRIYICLNRAPQFVVREVLSKDGQIDPD